MTDPTAGLPSRWACQSCGATDRVIHRTSPKGQPFAGKCADCLGGHSAQTMAIHRPANDWSWQTFGCTHDGAHKRLCAECKTCYPCRTVIALRGEIDG